MYPSTACPPILVHDHARSKLYPLARWWWWCLPLDVSFIWIRATTFVVRWLHRNGDWIRVQVSQWQCKSAWTVSTRTRVRARTSIDGHESVASPNNLMISFLSNTCPCCCFPLALANCQISSVWRHSHRFGYLVPVLPPPRPLVYGAVTYTCLTPFQPSIHPLSRWMLVCWKVSSSQPSLYVPSMFTWILDNIAISI